MAMEIKAPVRNPLRYGIFSVAEIRPAVDAHVFMGADWVTAGCHDAGRVGLDCQPGSPVATVIQTKDFADTGITVGEARSFVVYGSADCSPVGFDQELAAELARLHLVQREEKSVEEELWLGANTGLFTPANPGFVGISAQLNPALSPVLALAEVEQYLAEGFAAQGVIHVDWFLGSVLASEGLIRADGPVMRTRLGTPVVVGSGYAIDDAAPAIYGTGAIALVRGEIFSGLQGHGAGFNTKNNDLRAVAEREYLLAVDTCKPAVKQPVTLAAAV